MLATESLRDRYPDFSKELEMAIAKTRYSQPYGLKIWYSYSCQKSFKVVARKINQSIWGKGTGREKLNLFGVAIVEFDLAIQQLQFNNSEYTNIEPLNKLYKELVSFLPKNSAIQLQLNFQLH